MSSIGDYYEQNAEDIVKRYENANISNLHSFLLKIFRPGSKLLEIGSGSGRDASFLLKNNYNVDCLEKSQSMINQSIKYHPELSGHIIQCDVPKEFPDKKNYYDGVFAVASLMHLDIIKTRLTLKKIWSSLKKGGTLFFSIPLSRSDLESTGYDSTNRFFLLLTTNEWIEILKDTNFKEISTSTSIDGMGRKEIVWLNCFAKK